MGDQRLFLIDGHSLLYRSYYAIQRLSNSQGFPTNAIYGFINTLRKIKEREKPGFLGIVFDVKGPTVRHKVYKEYKAQRKPMPEDLEIQVPKLKEVLCALRIPFFEFKNYEADDVLANSWRENSLTLNCRKRPSTQPRPNSRAFPRQRRSRPESGKNFLRILN